LHQNDYDTINFPLFLFSFFLSFCLRSLSFSFDESRGRGIRVRTICITCLLHHLLWKTSHGFLEPFPKKQKKKTQPFNIQVNEKERMKDRKKLRKERFTSSFFW